MFNHISKGFCNFLGGQTDRPTDRQTDRQTDLGIKAHSRSLKTFPSWVPFPPTKVIVWPKVNVFSTSPVLLLHRAVRNRTLLAITLRLPQIRSASHIQLH